MRESFKESAIGRGKREIDREREKERRIEEAHSVVDEDNSNIAHIDTAQLRVNIIYVSATALTGSTLRLSCL